MRPFLRSSILILFGGIALIFLVPFLMRLSVSGEIYRTPQDVPEREVAIVLGASVVRGEPSPVLAARADTAAELYLNQKVKKILVAVILATSKSTFSIEVKFVSLIALPSLHMAVAFTLYIPFLSTASKSILL